MIFSQKTRISSLALAATLLASFSIPHAELSAQWSNRGKFSTTSFRGISIVSDTDFWITGSKGTFGISDNSGRSWETYTVPDAESFDLRDVHAVSMDTAYVMVAGQDTARIYKTTDRGLSWTLQYDDTRKGVFLDAISFWDAENGIALGDPIDGKFLVLTTSNGGATWTPVADASFPAALPGEAAFAASGTALVTHKTADGKRLAWFATGGGVTTRVFRSVDGGKRWTVSTTPVVGGAPSKGIFSLAFFDAKIGVAVGGDYQSPDTSVVTVATTKDGGVTWSAATPSAATGYLSGVTYLVTTGGSHLVAVGSKGSASSIDGGQTWTKLDGISLNAVATAPNGGVWGVGESGRIMLRRNLDP